MLFFGSICSVGNRSRNRDIFKKPLHSGRTYYVNHNNRSTQWNRPTAGATSIASSVASSTTPAVTEPTSDATRTPTPDLNRQISHTEDTQFMNRRAVSGKHSIFFYFGEKSQVSL